MKGINGIFISAISLDIILMPYYMCAILCSPYFYKLMCVCVMRENNIPWNCRAYLQQCCSAYYYYNDFPLSRWWCLCFRDREKERANERKKKILKSNTWRNLQTIGFFLLHYYKKLLLLLNEISLWDKCVIQFYNKLIIDNFHEHHPWVILSIIN